jgi:hypothetical protein
MEAARGHQAQELPAGAAVYRLLHQTCESSLADYSQRWQVDPAQLRAELPAIGMLARLAQPRLKRSASLIALACLLGSLVLAFALGLAAGFVRLGFHLLGGGR